MCELVGSVSSRSSVWGQCLVVVVCELVGSVSVVVVCELVGSVSSRSILRRTPAPGAANEDRFNEGSAENTAHSGGVQ